VSKLDDMYMRWQRAQQMALEAQNTMLLEEARFKGAVEVLGGQNWHWDGEAVVLEKPDALPAS
jgi:hypothetical protein